MPFAEWVAAKAVTATEHEAETCRREAYLRANVTADVIAFVNGSGEPVSISRAASVIRRKKEDVGDALKLLAQAGDIVTVPGRNAGQVAYRGVK